MYQAKLAGKHRYHVFDATLDRSVGSHHERLERILRALDAREFVLYYAPGEYAHRGDHLAYSATGDKREEKTIPTTNQMGV